MYLTFWLKFLRKGCVIYNYDDSDQFWDLTSQKYLGFLESAEVLKIKIKKCQVNLEPAEVLKNIFFIMSNQI